MRDGFIRTTGDVLRMLDTLLEDRSGGWWSDFFAEWPDENLAGWFHDELLGPGRVLELGCGNGRNATYLASLGCRVDAVDFSRQALEWARSRAARTGPERWAAGDRLTLAGI